MIPDIALMIVVYGGARLFLTALAPYRKEGRTAVEALAWIAALVAGAILLYLGIQVMQAGSTIGDLTTR